MYRTAKTLGIHRWHFLGFRPSPEAYLVRSKYYILISMTYIFSSFTLFYSITISMVICIDFVCFCICNSICALCSSEYCWWVGIGNMIGCQWVVVYDWKYFLWWCMIGRWLMLYMIRGNELALIVFVCFSKKRRLGLQFLDGIPSLRKQLSHSWCHK